jgi:acyl-CoA synthetase (AMP-forming)/AMP-acid ligase II
MNTFHLADLWETLADAGPEAECLVAGSARHTRGSLDLAANRLGHALLERGVQPSDHVGIYARNRVEYVEALLGCWKVGARPININWRYVAGELRYLLDDARVRGLVVERSYLPLLDELAGQVDLGAILVLEDGSAHEARNVVVEGYETAVTAALASRPANAERTGDDLYLLYTGGTTGMPKGVTWRHEDFFFACVLGGDPVTPISTPAEIAAKAQPTFPLDALVLGQLMHGGGQWLTLIAMYSGNRAIVNTDWSFSAERILDLVDRERPATIGLVGDAMGRPVAEAVLAHPGRWDLSSLVSIGNGGAMLTASVKEQLRRAFPSAAISDSFGASETGAAGRELDDGHGAGGSADGRADGPAFAPDPNTAVLDPLTLQPLTPGSPDLGLLARRGHIPLGYWNDEEKTARTFRVDGRGTRWVLPGDFARLDSEGRIVLVGRGSGCINSGGEKIFPEEVEAAVRSHPDVFDAVVVGVPDERFGQQVAAIVTLREGSSGLDLDQIQAHCRKRIAGYKVPRVLVLGEAPRTNVGKADYARAAEMARSHLGITPAT